MNTKITVGYVTQSFNEDGKCISQEFIAGDEVVWEDANFNSIEEPSHEYFPFHMEQPV